MSARGGAAIAFLLAALALASCSEDDGTRIGDAKIIDKLNLKSTEEGGFEGFAIDGDPFCLVADRLLNTADEVESTGGLVVASREGNVGVQGVSPFAPDCREEARKKLNKLDPPTETG